MPTQKSITSTVLFLVMICSFLKIAKPFSTAGPPYQYHLGPSPSIPTSSPAYPPVPSANSPNPQGIKAAYWPSFESFPVSSIDTTFFTHIYYAFLLPDPNTFELTITLLDLQKLPELIIGLRTKNPPVKTMLSIGGGGSDPNVFGLMASTKETRAVFINSTIDVARTYRFDGVDLDWEFPATVNDMANLGFLLQEWREAIENEAKTSGKGKPRLLLTSAVYYSSNITTNGPPRSYPANAIAEYLDWASPMCFDLHGKWDKFTGMHTALNDPNSDASISYGIGSWIQAGVPPEKLVMGLASYGHTWKLQDPNVNGIGAPAVGVGPGDQDGFFDYYAIIDFNVENNATVRFDATTASYYSYAGNSWIGYDDVGSIKIKVQYAQNTSLGGYFFWALGYDKDWALSKQALTAWE